jgi:hypothetical protein
MSRAGRRNERSPKIFKINIPIFQKKKMQTFSLQLEINTRYKIIVQEKNAKIYFSCAGGIECGSVDK